MLDEDVLSKRGIAGLPSGGLACLRQGKRPTSVSCMYVCVFYMQVSDNASKSTCGCVCVCVHACVCVCVCVCLSIATPTLNLFT